MWLRCSCGERHWGRYGAAGLLLTDPARTAVLLQKRSVHVHNGGTWSVPGGAIERGESPREAALREAHEEAGLDPRTLRVTSTLVGTDHGDWSYTYVVAEGERPEHPELAVAGSTELGGRPHDVGRPRPGAVVLPAPGPARALVAAARRASRLTRSPAPGRPP